MFSLAIIPLAVALVLAGGIIYYYFPVDFMRVFRSVDPAGTPSAGEGDEAGKETAAELREEVSRVRKLAAELNKGRLDVEWTERQLEEKSRKLDMLILKAEETLGKAASVDARTRTDNYSKAGMLLEMGLPPEEIKSRLGLLRGEVELIENLESYRSGGAGSVARGKKALHREDFSYAGMGERMCRAGQVA